MSFADDLDRLPLPALTPSERLLAALEMYDEGVVLQRNTLHRRHPRLSEVELDLLLDRWLRREGED